MSILKDLLRGLVVIAGVAAFAGAAVVSILLFGLCFTWVAAQDNPWIPAVVIVLLLVWGLGRALREKEE